MAEQIKEKIQNWSDKEEENLRKAERALDKRYEMVEETAEMLDEPVGKMLSITKGWSAKKLEKRIVECKKEENPAKCWWTKRKINDT